MNTLDLRNCKDPYRSAHDHVRAQRGRADEHDCIDCGKVAAHWSLRADPVADLMCVPGNNRRPRWVSPLPTDYQPRCAGCHRRHDMALRRTEVSA